MDEEHHCHCHYTALVNQAYGYFSIQLDKYDKKEPMFIQLLDEFITYLVENYYHHLDLNIEFNTDFVINHFTHNMSDDDDDPDIDTIDLKECQYYLFKKNEFLNTLVDDLDADENATIYSELLVNYPDTFVYCVTKYFYINLLKNPVYTEFIETQIYLLTNPTNELK